jgi:leader peptidase (prepilin peptidase) / N-methyltransferase
MLIVGAVAAALLVSPALSRCIALAAARRPDPRRLAAVAVAAALIVTCTATGALHAAALAAVAATGIVAVWIDAYRQRLPDLMVLPAYPVVGALLIATADPDTMLRAAACAAATALLYLAGFALGQLGFGDVKLGGLLGLVLGWAAWEAALIASVVAVLVSGLQAAAVLTGSERRLPLGPAMLLGAAGALALSAPA